MLPCQSLTETTHNKHPKAFQSTTPARFVACCRHQHPQLHTSCRQGSRANPCLEATPTSANTSSSAGAAASAACAASLATKGSGQSKDEPFGSHPPQLKMSVRPRGYQTTKQDPDPRTTKSFKGRLGKSAAKDDVRLNQDGLREACQPQPALPALPPSCNRLAGAFRCHLV